MHESFNVPSSKQLQSRCGRQVPVINHTCMQCGARNAGVVRQCSQQHLLLQRSALFMQSEHTAICAISCAILADAHEAC